MNKLRKVLDIIEHKHLDAIIVLSDYNRRYLSDFTGEDLINTGILPIKMST